MWQQLMWLHCVAHCRRVRAATSLIAIRVIYNTHAFHAQAAATAANTTANAAYSATVGISLNG